MCIHQSLSVHFAALSFALIAMQDAGIRKSSTPGLGIGAPAPHAHTDYGVSVNTQNQINWMLRGDDKLTHAKGGTIRVYNTWGLLSHSCRWPLALLSHSSTQGHNRI